MALEAAVFQQELFGNYNGKDLYSLLGGSSSSAGNHCSFGFDLEYREEEDDQKTCFFQHFPNNQTSETTTTDHDHNFFTNSTTYSCNNSTRDLKRRHRRSKGSKNKQEIENQRMTHIAVERNRRKQMNHYLSLLRSLMPDSYVQRGDQASIIGGAINFVKELEQRLQFLIAEKNGPNSSPFSEFFTFPQYSANNNNSVAMNESSVVHETQSAAAMADIEVTMVESHANIKIMSKRRRPGQLLKLVSGLNSLLLTILHLNVTTVDQTVLYCLSVKVEEDCNLSSVDEIATAVNQLLGRINQEADAMLKN